MTAKTKIQTLEKRLDNHRQEDPLYLITKIQRWKYGFAVKSNSDPITLQEWEEYKRAELKKGTPQTELDQTETEIRAKDGFMEIIFTEMDGTIIPRD